MSFDFGVNQALVEELFLRYRENPAAVNETWRRYFDGLTAQMPAATAAPVAAAPPADGTNLFTLPPTSENVPPFGTLDAVGTNARDAAVENQARVSAMVNSYRVRGHLFANLDPLGLRELPPFDLSLETFGLHKIPPETLFSYGNKKLPLSEIFERLNATYCRSIGAEFTFIENPEERRWLQHRMEDSGNRVRLDHATQLRILRKLTDAETFERFLHSTYLGAKRFSVEGAESMIPMLELIVDHASTLGVEEVVIGMAHRGRLNVLINVLELPPEDILAAFEDIDPERYLGSGDVKYHLGHSTDRLIGDRNVHLTLSFNPSHLEFVNPVCEGRVRAKQDRRGDSSSAARCCRSSSTATRPSSARASCRRPEPLQGCAPATGGTVVVVNNRSGFTTAWTDARSTGTAWTSRACSAAPSST
ncbi:MAG: hypothetical protein R3B82_19725 [Sandaracinaceae bacterium]